MSILAFSLLAAMLVTYAILDGYDLGVGMMLHLFSRSEDERGAAIASIGPYWSGNEVWFIAAGGVLFAFFPRAYAVSFSGFYLPFMFVLWLLIFRGISLELRSHYSNTLWHDFWDMAFALASATLTLILGVALGNLLRGLPLDRNGNFIGSLALLLNPYALAVAIFALVVLAGHGWCYLHMQLPQVQTPARKRIGYGLWWSVLLLDLIVTVLTYVVHPLAGPMLLVACMLGALAFIALVAAGVLFRQSKTVAAFIASSAAIATLLGAAVVTLYPYLIPSSTSSPGLTIFEATPYGGIHIEIVSIVVIGLLCVYTYLALVLRKLARPYERS